MLFWESVRSLWISGLYFRPFSGNFLFTQVFYSLNGRMIVIKNMRFPIAVFTFYMVRSGIMVC